MFQEAYLYGPAILTNKLTFISDLLYIYVCLFFDTITMYIHSLSYQPSENGYGTKYLTKFP